MKKNKIKVVSDADLTKTYKTQKLSPSSLEVISLKKLKWGIFGLFSSLP